MVFLHNMLKSTAYSIAPVLTKNLVFNLSLCKGVSQVGESWAELSQFLKQTPPGPLHLDTVLYPTEHLLMFWQKMQPSLGIYATNLQYLLDFHNS